MKSISQLRKVLQQMHHDDVKVMYVSIAGLIMMCSIMLVTIFQYPG